MISNMNLKGKFNVLLLFEPESVSPWQYRRSVLARFDLVIPMSPWRAERLGLKEWAYYPVEFREFRKEEEIRTREVVLLNAAKFSANGKSNYGLRRKISKRMYKFGIDYDLIGANWQMSKVKEFRERFWAIRRELICWKIPNLSEALSEFTYRYPEYRGETENKLKELVRFRYALIIENESDWITEKLFDALSAGCVPLYIGPSLARLPSLQRCVVELQPSVESVIEFFTRENVGLYLEKKSIVDDVKNYEDDWNKFKIEVSASKISKATWHSFSRFKGRVGIS